MKKSQKVNLALFISFCFAVMMFAYVFGSDFLKKQEKPWHMQPSVSDEVLSDSYSSKYETIGPKSILSTIADTSKVVLNILIDGWGVPLNEQVLKEEFELLEDVPHKEYIHQRLANRTKHAEFVELRTDAHQSIYLFGGDSLEYERPSYIRGLGYGRTNFCQFCNDNATLSIIDSLLENKEYKQIAWTATSAREGSSKNLNNLLKSIVELAKENPDVIFIVQGTHRPILGTPERRKKFYSHWVPAVVLN